MYSSLLLSVLRENRFSKRRHRTLSIFPCVWTYIMKTLRAPIIILNYVFFLQRSLAAIVLERLFFFLTKKSSYWKRLVFPKKIHTRKILSLCMSHVLWCVKTLTLSKFPCVCEKFDILSRDCFFG